MSVYRLPPLRYLLQRWDRRAHRRQYRARSCDTHFRAHSESMHRSRGTRHHHARRERGPLHHQRRSRRARRAADEIRAANIPGVKSVQPLIFDRVTIPDLDSRNAILDGRGYHFANARRRKPAEGRNTKTRHCAETATASGSGGDSKRRFYPWAGQLWDRIPGRLVMLSRPIYTDWLAKTGGKKPFVVRFATATSNVFRFALSILLRIRRLRRWATTSSE